MAQSFGIRVKQDFGVFFPSLSRMLLSLGSSECTELGAGAEQELRAPRGLWEPFGAVRKGFPRISQDLGSHFAGNSFLG